MFNVNANIDARQFNIEKEQYKKQTPLFLAKAIKAVAQEMMENVLRPQYFPIDLGTARAGFEKGAKKAGAKFSPVTRHTLTKATRGRKSKSGLYEKGIRAGKKMGKASLTKRKFEADNLVGYVAKLETSHSGRKAAKRYGPPRMVGATGPYKGFTDKATKDTVKASNRLLKPILRASFGNLSSFQK